MKEQMILAATDGSEVSENAVRYAGEIAKTMGVKLVLFHVCEHEKGGYWPFIERPLTREMEQATERIEKRVTGMLDSMGVSHEMEHKAQKDAPHVEIVDYLEAHSDVLAVVMGERGSGLRGHRSMGSTTEKVIHEISARGLPVPVVVVPSAGYRKKAA